MFFWEYIDSKKISYLYKALWSYICSKFWESYTPLAIQIRVNSKFFGVIAKNSLFVF